MRFWWKNGFRLKVRKMGFNVQPVSREWNIFRRMIRVGWERKRERKKRKKQINVRGIKWNLYFSRASETRGRSRMIHENSKNFISTPPLHPLQPCSYHAIEVILFIYDFMTHTFAQCFVKGQEVGDRSWLHLGVHFYVIFMLSFLRSSSPAKNGPHQQAVGKEK